MLIRITNNSDSSTSLKISRNVFANITSRGDKVFDVSPEDYAQLSLLNGNKFKVEELIGGMPSNPITKSPITNIKALQVDDKPIKNEVIGGEIKETISSKVETKSIIEEVKVEESSEESTVKKTIRKKKLDNTEEVKTEV